MANRHQIADVSFQSPSGAPLYSYKNIVIFCGEKNRYIGFHTRNLVLAELDPQLADLIEALDKGLPLTPTLTEIQEELEQWNSEAAPEVHDVHAQQKVRALSINISQICNLRCTYCAAGDGTYGSSVAHIDTAMAEKQIQWFLAQTPAGETFSLRLIGGEPLIYPDAVEAIVKAAQVRAAEKGVTLKVSLVTNGTLVTDKIAQLLVQLKIGVTVSLDGPPQKNDLARKSVSGGGSTEKVLKGLSVLFRYQKDLPSLDVNSVFGSHNIDVMDTYLYLREFPWDHMRFTYAASTEDAIWSPQYIAQLMAVAERAYADGGIHELTRIFDFGHFLKQIEKPYRIHNFCGAGKDTLTIDTEGRLYGCIWSVNKKSEQIGVGTFLDAKRLEPYKSSLIERQNCHDCWARYMCGGGCMYVNQVTTGDKYKKDAEFCQRTQSTIAKMIELSARSQLSVST